MEPASFFHLIHQKSNKKLSKKLELQIFHFAFSSGTPVGLTTIN